jgi:hypothetical protein
MFLIVSKTGKNNFFTEYRNENQKTNVPHQKPYRNRSEEESSDPNSRSTGTVPGYISETIELLELPKEWRIQIQNQFARRP